MRTYVDIFLHCVVAVLFASRRVILFLFIVLRLDFIHYMMDIFASALADSVETDTKVDARSTTAPSPDIPQSSETCITIPDDADTDGYSVEDPIARGHSTSQAAPSTKRSTSKVPSPQSDFPAKKRNRSEGTKPLHLKPVEVGKLDKESGKREEWHDLTCIFVKTGKHNVPVPLWSQYTATWKGVEDKRATWIVVSSWEWWLMRVIDAVTAKSVRQVGKTFTDYFRKEFLACMASARRPGVHEDPLADDDSSDDKTKRPKRSQTFEVQANIGGYSVNCLNHTTRMVLKVDQQTVTFITGWIVPLVRKLAHSQAMKPSGSESTTEESPTSLAGFHFQASPTPNIRDKVCWNPSIHAWKLVLHKTKDGKISSNFCVEPNLPADKYEKERIAEYWNAVEAWNRMDGSKRVRIPMTRLRETTASD
jgi:hypothetical protein